MISDTKCDLLPNPERGSAQLNQQLELLGEEYRRSVSLGLLDEGSVTSLMTRVSDELRPLSSGYAVGLARVLTDCVVQLNKWVDQGEVSPDMVPPLLQITKPDLLASTVCRCRTDFESIELRLTEALGEGVISDSQAQGIRSMRYLNDQAAAVIEMCTLREK